MSFGNEFTYSNTPTPAIVCTSNRLARVFMFRYRVTHLSQTLDRCYMWSMTEKRVVCRLFRVCTGSQVHVLPVAFRTETPRLVCPVYCSVPFDRKELL